MKRGVDTNILVNAHLAAFPEHVLIRDFLLDQLRTPDMTLVLSASILHEFVHVITDHRRFEDPVAMREALALARLYLGRSNVECLGADETIVLEAFDLLERHRLGRKRLADTLFAATLLHHDVHEIITCNRRDFEVFPDLRVVDPLGS